jgi:hypothetical protein
MLIYHRHKPIDPAERTGFTEDRQLLEQPSEHFLRRQNSAGQNLFALDGYGRNYLMQVALIQVGHKKNRMHLVFISAVKSLYL